MKTEKVSIFGKSMNLVSGLPTADELSLMVTNGLNVLFIGPHGVGKTQTVRQTANTLGLQLGYYHTPSLDPYIDFIGVPYPSENKDGTFDLLKSRQIKDAEILFFDEINRADDRILNALFEIIQFRSVNGTPFPKVRSVFAAINPNDDGYHVNELDAALLDRFDAVIYVGPKYDLDIMASEFGGDDRAIRLAKALVDWAPNVSEGYVSPRALSRIGKVFSSTNHKMMTFASVPMGVTFSRNELWGRLVAARDNQEYKVNDKISDAAAKKSVTMSGPYDKNKFNDLKRQFLKDATTTGKKSDDWIANLDAFSLNEIKSIGCSPGSRSKFRFQLDGYENYAFMKGIAAKSTDQKVNAWVSKFAPANAGTPLYDWFRKNGFYYTN